MADSEISASRWRLGDRWGMGLLCIMVASLALRLNGGLHRDLWEDEIIAVTHAMQPWWELPIEVARHDVHPFLYFFQLHLWGLIGSSDLWFKLNSVFWNLVAIGSIGIVGKRLYSTGAGLLAAALLALFPPSVWMAQEVRPYSWLFVLIVWGFCWTETACRINFRSWGIALRLLAISVAIIYSHALGFLIVFLLGVYAFIALICRSAPVQAYRTWLIIFAASGILAVPPLATDLLRDANLGGVDGLVDVAMWLPRMVMPRGDNPVMIATAAGVFVIVTGLGLGIAATRLMTSVFIVLPLALGTAMASLGMVLFKLNIFSSLEAPFFVLVLSLLLQRPRRQIRACIIALCAILFGVGSITYLENRVPTTGFRAAARMIQGYEQPGDIVYVPQQSMFWGMAWYLVGPHWGSALEISGQTDAQWRRMYNRLGRRLVALLHLEPKSQTLESPGGLTLLVGPSSAAQADVAKRVWLITYDRADLPSGFPQATLGRFTQHQTMLLQQLKVTLYQ
jgi:mannosyltransferase